MMRNILIVLAAALPMAACELEIPDLNNPGEDELRNNPSAELVRVTATGLLIGHRDSFRETKGYISQLGILGRESYNFDTGDPRYRTEMLSSMLSDGDPVHGGNFWELPYANIHMANLLLEATDKVTGFSEGQREGIRGFAKTIQALDYLIVVNTRGENGAAIATSTEVDVLPELVPNQDGMFNHIESLLDEAQGDLENATEFPFPLSSGFAGFDTPDTFLTVNRAIRARVAVYRGNYDEALTYLGESFLVVDAANPQLGLGVYNSYGTGAGDSPNELVATFLYAHPSLATDAQAGDQRLAQKTVAVTATTLDMLTADRNFTIYPSTSSPIPIIRNEELILLRAEANFGAGNLAEAIADINFLRVQSGGLAERTDLTMDNFFDELVYQRRYGLLFEGHRWVDMRRWDLLGDLPLDRTGDGVVAAFPIPANELNARE
jgi:hypothetical protein